MKKLNFRRTELSFFRQLFLIVLALLNNGGTWEQTQNKFWICITISELWICCWKFFLAAGIKVVLSNYFTTLRHHTLVHIYNTAIQCTAMYYTLSFLHPDLLLSGQFPQKSICTLIDQRCILSKFVDVWPKKKIMRVCLYEPYTKFFVIHNVYWVSNDFQLF